MQSFLYLDLEEDVEMLDTTPGWTKEGDWVPYVVPAGKYRAERAANPHYSDSLWVFIQGSKIGQREGWLKNASKDGIKAKLMIASPLPEAGDLSVSMIVT